MSARLCRIALFFLAMLGAGWSLPSRAETESYENESEVPKKALVIGIDKYDTLPPIPSAAKDLQSVKEKLEALSFTVMAVSNPDATALWKAVKAFQETIDIGDVAFVYFSGHGFQWIGESFLVPRDADRSIDKDDVARLNIPVSNLMSRLSSRQPGFTLIALDACRDNNLNIKDGSVEKAIGKAGLAYVDPHELAPQLIVSFAAAPGNVAQGSSDPETTSLYTRHLAQHIDKAGEAIDDILQETGNSVFFDGQTQKPEVRYLAPLGSFYPNPNSEVREMARATWRSILESPDRAKVHRFIHLWPASAHSGMARKWLNDHPVLTAEERREPNTFVVRSARGGPAAIVRTAASDFTLDSLNLTPPDQAMDQKVRMATAGRDLTYYTRSDSADARVLVEGTRFEVAEESDVANGKAIGGPEYATRLDHLDPDADIWRKIEVPESASNPSQTGYIPLAGTEYLPAPERPQIVLSQPSAAALTPSRDNAESADKLREELAAKFPKEIDSKTAVVIVDFPNVVAARTRQGAKQGLFLYSLHVTKALEDYGVPRGNIVAEISQEILAASDIASPTARTTTNITVIDTASPKKE